MVVSPPYPCQLVLVAKLTAVLKEESVAEQVEHQQAGEVEEQHGHGVGLPAHLLVGPDPGQSVDQPLQPAERLVQPERLVLVDAGHVGAQGFGQGDQNEYVERELKDPVRRHEKSSGFNRAMTR
jgi:hypothetical protein